MPSVIQGFVITTKPKDVTLESFPTVDNIAAGATATIVYPSQYKGVAISVAIINQDGANSCTISLNGSTTFVLSAGGSFNVNDQKAIRFGMGAVKGVGRGAVQTIIENRKDGEYKSIFDFAKRINLRLANKTTFENLILAGSFDSFNLNRSQYFNIDTDGYTFIEKSINLWNGWYLV